jgi:AcrR family transcriptional regulator
MSDPARAPKPVPSAAARPGPARAYGGVSEEQRRAARRLRLLEAGLEIIGTQGYAAATLRAVCARAELTERYFYESFANREALLVGVHRWVVDQLRADLAAGFQRSDASADGRARTGLAVFFEMLRADPRKARVLLFEMLGVSADLDRMYQQTAGRIPAFRDDRVSSADAGRAAGQRRRGDGLRRSGRRGFPHRDPLAPDAIRDAAADRARELHGAVQGLVAHTGRLRGRACAVGAFPCRCAAPAARMHARLVVQPAPPEGAAHPSDRRNRMLHRLIAIAATLLILAGGPAAAQTLKWAAQNDILTFDPHSQNHATTNTMIMHVYEGLTRYDRNYKVEPALATSWQQMGPLQWRFNLRKDVKFQDGSPFTADDVVFSFGRIRQPQGTMQIYVTGVKEVKKVDANTVDFLLEAPSADPAAQHHRLPDHEQGLGREEQVREGPRLQGA